MKRSMIMVLTLLLFSAPAIADERAQLSELRGLLIGIDTLPGKASFQAVSPNVHKLLFQLATSDKEHGYVRERATGYLGFFRDKPGVFEQLKGISLNAPEGLREVAIFTLAHAFKNLRGLEVADFLGQFLSSKSERIRGATIRSLARIPQPRALLILQQHTDRSKSLQRLRGLRLKRLQSLLKSIKKKPLPTR